MDCHITLGCRTGEEAQADNSKDNPDAHCLPMGFLQFHNHPEPRKIIQTPKIWS